MKYLLIIIFSLCTLCHSSDFIDLQDVLQTMMDGGVLAEDEAAKGIRRLAEMQNISDNEQIIWNRLNSYMQGTEWSVLFEVMIENEKIIVPPPIDGFFPTLHELDRVRGDPKNALIKFIRPGDQYPRSIDGTSVYFEKLPLPPDVDSNASLMEIIANNYRQLPMKEWKIDPSVQKLGEDKFERSYMLNLFASHPGYLRFSFFERGLVTAEYTTTHISYKSCAIFEVKGKLIALSFVTPYFDKMISTADSLWVDSHMEEWIAAVLKANK